MIVDLSSDYKQLSFTEDKLRELDLGCGNGSYICQLAHAFPEREFIAVDIMIGRLRSLQAKCQQQQINNISIVRSNAWNLVDFHLPDNCLDRVHVLCPDPWPKKKHYANRLLFTEFISRLINKIKPGGCLHLGTDYKPYFEQMLNQTNLLSQVKENDSLMTEIKQFKTDFEMNFNEQGIEVMHKTWEIMKSNPHK